ncbi:MAG: phosphatase PAP2 family protein [Methylococcales bacterium]
MTARPISGWRPVYLGLWQLGAILLLASWFTEPTRSLWLCADDQFFRYFNDGLKSGSDFWRMLWAVSNHRLFDGVSAGFMALVFFVSAWRQGRARWCWHAALFSVTVMAVLIGTRIGHLIPVERPSATMLYKDVFRLSHWALGFETKDISYSTFPGDHAMVAFIACGYAFHYLGRAYFLAALGAGWVIVMPRLVCGAHWLSDEVAGAGFVTIVVLSWSFYTPFADLLLASADRIWRRIYFQ